MIQLILCILGLLDFTGNQKIFNIFGKLFIIILIVTVYFIKKDYVLNQKTFRSIGGNRRQAYADTDELK